MHSALEVLGLGQAKGLRDSGLKDSGCKVSLALGSKAQQYPLNKGPADLSS